MKTNRILTGIGVTVCFSGMFLGAAVAQKENAVPNTDEQLLPPTWMQPPLALPASNPLAYSNVKWPSPQIIAETQLKGKSKYEEEIERTWYWFKTILADDFLPPAEEDSFLLLPNMKNGDDWIGTRYVVKDVEMQVIDGRSMTVVAKPLHPEQFQTVTMAPREQPPRQEEEEDNPKKMKVEIPQVDNAPMDGAQAAISTFAHAVFRRTINFDDGLRYAKVETAVKDVKQQSKGAYTGRIEVLAARRHWLKDEVAYWWSDGSVVVFEFQKLMAPPRYSKGSYVADAKEYVGGIANEDSRPFVRFDSERAIDFPAEFEKIFPFKRGAVETLDGNRNQENLQGNLWDNPLIFHNAAGPNVGKR